MISITLVIALYLLGAIHMLSHVNETGTKHNTKLGRMMIVGLWPGVIVLAIAMGAYDWIQVKRHV